MSTRQCVHCPRSPVFDVGGVLDVSVPGTFESVRQQVFDLFDFDPARLTGLFSHLLLPVLAKGLAWDESDLYTLGVLRIDGTQAEPSAIALLLAAALVWRRPRQRGRSHRHCGAQPFA